MEMRPPIQKRWMCGLLPLLLLLPVACNSSDDPAPAPPPVTSSPEPIRTVRTRDEGLPGTVVEITSVAAGSGAQGQLVPGDTVAVTYTVELGDGTPVPLAEVDFAAILVSGPTFNYQPVLARKSDLATASVTNPDGSHTYTFADPVPAAYLPPLNDSPSFGPEDGELQGQPLLAGTYTVGIEIYKGYTIEGTTYRDADNAVFDVLVGSAQSIDIREVVAQANCNTCHNDLRVHGTIRREVRHCMLCHTAGAEDPNVATVAGGTPGVTIDFKVMIHKIHNGAHLPSVLGVGTKPDGSRDYTVPPKPYQIVGFGNSVHDFSDIDFPVWPNLTNPLPRDEGYGKLTSTEQGLENQIRSGAANCSKCHGDPDGPGPLAAPANGNLAFDNANRLACGSCHDDIDWDLPYVSNQLRMPEFLQNSTCDQCHPGSGSPIAVAEGHMHPMKDPALDPGLVFAISAVREAGAHNGDGNLDPGETIEIDYAITDRNGAPVDPSTLARMEVALAGPTTNRNILTEGRFPADHLPGASGTTGLPEQTYLEIVGVSTTTPGETFKTLRDGHWNVSQGTTAVRIATSIGAFSNLSAAVPPLQNHFDVVDPTGLDRGDYIALVDAVPPYAAELVRVQWVDGNRLWLSSLHGTYDQPWVRFPHAAGAWVVEVNTKPLVEGTDYTLDPTAGTITEMAEFGPALPVFVTYTTDFRMPSVFPPALNDTPELGQNAGEWTGLPLVDGTYSLGIWGEVPIRVPVVNETTTYNAVGEIGLADFLVGANPTLQPAMQISSPQNCNACHNDVYFHGTHRRGFATCILCHGTAGSEDRPSYVAPNATITAGVTIDFRTMLHKIHMGKDLANASTYGVNGFGSGYPNNYTTHTYEHVGFPVFPGAAARCETCHGQGNTAWQLPVPRLHPLGQTAPTQAWAATCGACHDAAPAQAHIAVNTAPNGGESCAVCHGRNDEQAVERMHRTW